MYKLEVEAWVLLSINLLQLGERVVGLGENKMKNMLATVASS
jgi:hypothetical protein